MNERVIEVATRIQDRIDEVLEDGAKSAMSLGRVSDWLVILGALGAAERRIGDLIAERDRAVACIEKMRDDAAIAAKLSDAPWVLGPKWAAGVRDQARDTLRILAEYDEEADK